MKQRSCRKLLPWLIAERMTDRADCDRPAEADLQRAEAAVIETERQVPNTEKNLLCLKEQLTFLKPVLAQQHLPSWPVP